MSASACPMYDVAIIGLGPAGATLARLLDPRLAVVAIDRKAAAGNTGYAKACGGLLAPDAQRALAAFDLALPGRVLSSPQIFSVRTIDMASGLERRYPRHYINLDRQAFDRWLISLIPTSVTVHLEARCTAIRRVREGYELDWTGQGHRHTLRARYLIGADGAASIVRRTCCPAATIRTYTAVQQWYTSDNADPFFSCLFDPELTDCYAWGLSKNGQFIFGGAFAPRQARVRFTRLLAKARGVGFRLQDPIRTEACLVLRPASSSQICCGQEDCMLVGEAAGFISPSSLEGLSYGFRSAAALAQALNSGTPHPVKAYTKNVLPLLLSIVGKLGKSPFIFNPALRRLIMRSGIRSLAGR